MKEGRRCVWQKCLGSMLGKRRGAKFCSRRCRQALWRAEEYMRTHPDEAAAADYIPLARDEQKARNARGGKDGRV